MKGRLYMCPASFLLRRLGGSPGDELVAVRVGEAAEGDLVGVIFLTRGEGGGAGEGDESEGGYEVFGHCGAMVESI